MTRVLMTADAVGGVWTYALELADALAPYDVEVHLAVLGPRMSAGQRAEVARSHVRSVHERELRLEWMDDPWADVDAAGEWLLRLEGTLGVDLVHLNGYAHAVLPWRAPVVVVAHSDVVSWWRAVHGAPPPPTWDTYRERVTAGLRAAAAVVAPTHAVLEDLAMSFGFDGGVVVPNCRRDDWVRTRPKERMILGAGRGWDNAKNLRSLQASARHVPWPVLLAGEQAAATGGPPAAAAVGDGDRSATLLGRLTFAALAGWLTRAAVFAAPAKYEPFGLGVLEAAHAGCALVLGDIPSLREVWDDAAVYVDPHDAQALTCALVDLCARSALVDELGHRARERAARYLPNATAAAYLDLYRPLLVKSVSA